MDMDRPVQAQCLSGSYGFSSAFHAIISFEQVKMDTIYEALEAGKKEKRKISKHCFELHS